MGAEIDSLEIKLQANAQTANRSLDTLVKKLDALAVSLGRVNGSNLISLSNGVNRLATSMQSIRSVGTADFTRLAKNISKMGDIDAASIGRAASSLHGFTNALQSLDSVNVSDNAAQIVTLSNGIKQLGYKSAGKAIENIPKLATSMRQLMSTLSGAPKVSQNLIDMTNALAKLSRTGASSGRAATSLGKALDTYTASTGRASKGTFSLASAIGKLYATYWLLFRAFGKIGDAIDISSDLTEVQNVVDVTFGNMASKVEDFAKTSIEQFGMSELSLKQYTSRFQAMGSAMGIDKSLIAGANSFLNGQTKGYIGLSDSMSDVSLNLTKLTADMASFYNVEQKDVAEDLSAIFTGMTRPLRQYGLDLTEATLKEWAMKHGMDSNIDSMTQAEKTMLRYQYVLANTVAAQGDFARTADTWANQVRILKQNFEQLAAIIGGAFINALKPLVRALNAAMQHIIAFAQLVSNALGKIFGWTFENGAGGFANDMEDAAGSVDDIESGMSGAEDAAKKLKTHLLGIDELNVVEPQEESESGGGSGGISGGGVTGIDDLEGGWKKSESIFESEIDNLFELGKKIGDVLTNALNNINWEKVYQGAKDFGKGLADFLNGLISPELFGAVGRTIAGALNTAVYAALAFGENFNWKNLGLSIATGINEFFRTFDFASLADAIDAWVQGIWATITSCLANLSWKDIFNGVKQFLSHIDLETVAILINCFTLKYGTKLLTKMLMESTLVSKIKDLIPELLTFLLPVAITLTIADIAFEGWKEKFDLSDEDIESAFNIPTEKLIEAQEKTKEESMSNNKFGMGNRYAQMQESTDFWKNIDSWWYDNAPLAEFRKNFSEMYNELVSYDWSVDTIFPEAKNWGQNFAEIWEEIKQHFSGGSEEVSTYDYSFDHVFPEAKNWSAKFQESVESIRGWLDGIPQWFEEKKDEIQNWYETSVAPWFSIDTWYALADGIFLGLQEKWTEIVEWWQNTALFEWWEENVAPWFSVDKWGETAGGIKQGIETKWNETVKSWTINITKWWDTNVAPWFTKKKWKEMLDSIPSAFKEGFKDAANGAISFMNEVIEGAEFMVNKAIEAFNKLVSSINKILGAAGLPTIKFNVENIKLPRIPQFAVGGFPEDGLFMANHTELVGKFSNGRTAVANNEMIVAGIEEAAYRGFARANAENNIQNELLREQNRLLAEMVSKEVTAVLDTRDTLAGLRQQAKREGFVFST